MSIRAVATHQRFAAFELDGRTGELYRNGVRLPLAEQPLALLRAKEFEAAFDMKDASKVDTVSGLTLTPSESARSGAVGYEAGTYSITMAPAGGTKMTDTGKYVVVFKQVGENG